MSDDDLILLCAFRYCVGRRTYIVSDCVRWIRERWERLSPDARQLLIEELGEQIRRENLGSMIDAPLWRDLHAWMKHHGC